MTMNSNTHLSMLPQDVCGWQHSFPSRCGQQDSFLFRSHFSVCESITSGHGSSSSSIQIVAVLSAKSVIVGAAAVAIYR